MNIAFLQVNDEDTKVPEESPYKGQYTRWCYASQKRLAFRSGTTEPAVCKIIEKFKSSRAARGGTAWATLTRNTT
jgi:hypothetical protein